MYKLLKENYAVFSKSYQTLGETDAIVPNIELMHDFPIQTKPYPLPNALKNVVQKEIEELLKYGLIEKSQSNYCFPILMVKKPQKEGQEVKYRMAVDYRALNTFIPLLPVELPRIKEILHKISGHTLYTVLDLKAAFFQIKIQPKDKEKLSFETGCLGQFSPNRLPFGLKNSGAYFQILMDKVLGDLREQDIYFYLDDLVICGNSSAEIMNKMQTVFNRLKEKNLTLDPNKVQICKSEIEFLGYKINNNGISPSKKNCAKIQNFKNPTTVRQVKSFLGTTNYFRSSIPNYAQMAEPLINLTRKNIKFKWDIKCEEAFENLKRAIFNEPTVRAPDFKEQFILNTDASNTGLSGNIYQVINGVPHVIEYYSRGLNDAEKRYQAIKLELLAIYETMQHFREYLFGREFVLLSDAKSLMHHLKLEKQPSIIARWLMEISTFTFQFQHQPGECNPADYSSRYIFNQECQENGVNNIMQTEEFNTKRILKEQMGDIKIKKIRKAVEEGKIRMQRKNKYFIDNTTGLLMITRINKGDRFKINKENKIVIPKTLRKEVLQAAHFPHFGIDKTLQIMQKKYYWTGMLADTENYVKSCDKCLRVKDKNIPPAKPQIMSPVFACAEHVQIDIVGKLPRSTRGHCYIVTMLDMFSRHLEAYPVKNISAQTIVDTMIQYCTTYGLFRTIQSDNGVQFKSKEYIDFTNSLNIERRYNSVAKPSSLGRLERAHHLMKESMICIANKTFDWDESLKWFKLYINNTKNKTTGYEPSFLFFLRDLHLPGENIQNKEERNDSSKVSLDLGDQHNYKEYIKQNLQYFTKIMKETTELQKSAAEKQAQRYTVVRMKDIEVGDTVFLKKLIKPPVLSDKFTGPYRVIQKIRNNNIMIREKGNCAAKMIKIHINKCFVASERRKYLRNENESNANENTEIKQDNDIENDRNDNTDEQNHNNNQNPRYYLRPRVFVNSNIREEML